jgi:hypothetical protein
VRAICALRLPRRNARLEPESGAAVVIAALMADAGTTFTRESLMTALLTVEGLIFAALSISVGLTASDAFGLKTAVPPAVLAFIATGVLTVIAVAAVLAWTDVLAGDHWPSGTNGRIEALVLLFAIVAQPILASITAVGLVRG